MAKSVLTLRADRLFLLTPILAIGYQQYIIKRNQTLERAIKDVKKAIGIQNTDFEIPITDIAIPLILAGGFRYALPAGTLGWLYFLGSTLQKYGNYDQRNVGSWIMRIAIVPLVAVAGVSAIQFFLTRK